MVPALQAWSPEFKFQSHQKKIISLSAEIHLFWSQNIFLFLKVARINFNFVFIILF
jgi:hypothetical protein